MRRRGLGPGHYAGVGSLGSITTVGGTPTPSQPGGTDVVGCGTGLGPGVPTVTVNGHVAAVVSHNGTQIRFTLPSHAGTGPITVTVAGVVVATYPAFTTT